MADDPTFRRNAREMHPPVAAQQPAPPEPSASQSDTGDGSDSAWLDFSPPDDWRGIPNHFNQGLTSGTYDEAAAATQASIDAGYDHAFGDPGEQGFTDQWDQIYTQKQKAHNDWLDDYARRNPKSAMAADLVGAIVQAGLTGGVSALWKAGTHAVGKSGVALVKAGSGVGGKLGKALSRPAVAGAASGTIAGAGYARPGDRLSGAAIGGMLGPVMPLAMGGVRGLKTRIRQANSPDYQANKQFQEAVNATESSPEIIARELDELGPDGLLIDALDSPGRNMGRSLINASNRAEKSMISVISKREAGRTSRVVDTFEKSSGIPLTTTSDDVIQSVIEQDRPRIRAAYDKARKAGKDFDSKLFDDLIKKPTIKKFYRKGKAEAIDDASDGTTPTEFDDWTETSQLLGEKAAVARRKGRSKTARKYSKLSKKVRDRLVDAVPEDGKARALARASFARQDAIKLGAKAAKATVSGKVIQKMKDIDPAHQPWLAKGYASEMMHRVDNRRGTPGMVDALFGDNRSAQAMRLAFGEEGAKPLQQQIAAERVMAQTANALRGNSTTAKQMSNMKGISFPFSGDAWTSFLARKFFANRAKKKAARMEPAINRILEDQLMQHDASPLFKSPVFRYSNMDRFNDTIRLGAPVLSGHNAGRFSPGTVALMMRDEDQKRR